MNKELLNKIMPYCGHRLKVAIYDEYDKMALNDVATIVGVKIEDGYFMVKRFIDISMSFNINMKENRPILFHPDCLSREIETEYGKEIPLIEMAKIAFPKIKEWWIDTIYAQSKNVYFYFNGHDSFNSGSCHALEIQNQWGVFQYLYSRHIAFNLNPDDYVSVESLEKNPYAI